MILRDRVSSELKKRRFYYRTTRAEAVERNIRNLKTVSAFSLMLLVFCIIMAPVIIKGWHLSVYHIILLPAVALCSAAAYLYSTKLEKTYRGTVMLCMFFDAITMLFGMMIDIMPNSETPAIFTPLLYIVLPILFIIPQIYTYMLITAAEIVYIFLTYAIKAHEVAQYDVYDSIVGFAFSVVIIQIIQGFRVKDYMMRVEYRDLSMKDSLSGLLNKDYFHKAVDAYLKTRGTHAPHALCIIDMDDFKLINDNYGHNTGDKVLQLAAHIIRETFRSSDIVGRFGGDEFVVFAKDTAERSVLEVKSEIIQEQLRRQTREHFSLEANCSIGIVLADKGLHSYSQLFECADKALYQAKDAGKRTYVMVDYDNAEKQ